MLMSPLCLSEIVAKFVEGLRRGRGGEIKGFFRKWRVSYLAKYFLTQPHKIFLTIGLCEEGYPPVQTYAICAFQSGKIGMSFYRIDIRCHCSRCHTSGIFSMVAIIPINSNRRKWNTQNQTGSPERFFLSRFTYLLGHILWQLQKKLRSFNGPKGWLSVYLFCRILFYVRKDAAVYFFGTDVSHLATHFA